MKMKSRCRFPFAHIRIQPIRFPFVSRSRKKTHEAMTLRQKTPALSNVYSTETSTAEIRSASTWIAAATVTEQTSIQNRERGV